ncbi:MAG: hypothetical protein QXN05_04500 [Acidilobaceae archaeon]
MSNVIRIVKVLGYYRDASFLEVIIANFRKLLVDIEWIYGRRLDEVSGLYEVYLGLRDNPNLNISLLNLSKLVGIESFEVLGETVVECKTENILSKL